MAVLAIEAAAGELDLKKEHRLARSRHVLTPVVHDRG